MNRKTFKAKVGSILRDNKNDREVHRMRTGSLDTKSYKNLKTTGKCFKKTMERKGKNYAISLLLDASGSMGDIRLGRATSDGRWEGASRSGTIVNVIPKLAQTLEEVGANVEINAFNWLMFPMIEFGEKVPKDFRKTFSKRYDKAMHATVKSWKIGDKIVYNIKPKGEVRKSGCDYHSALGHNYDAWAIHQASLRLLQESGEKILIIFSDGEPTSRNYYHEGDLNKRTDQYSIPYEVKWAKQRGIKVLSIGVQTDYVTAYYPIRDCGVIHDLSEMYDKVTRLLSTNIKRL